MSTILHSHGRSGPVQLSSSLGQIKRHFSDGLLAGVLGASGIQVGLSLQQYPFIAQTASDLLLIKMFQKS